MTIFKSPHPDIELPTDITIWEWLFGETSRYSPLNNVPPEELAGYLDASTRERVSWRQVKEAATYISTALTKQYGFEAGDTISLFSRNSIWYPVTLFAAIRVGGVVSGASPAYNVEEMTYALKTAKAKFLATHPSSMAVASQAAANAGIPRSRIFLLEGKLDGYTTVQQLIEAGRAYGEQAQAAAHRLPPGGKNGDLCGFLSFSSGTTGLPKAVMISHQNVIAQALQIQQLTPDLTPDEGPRRKSLGALPLFHITGLVHSLHLPVFMNAEVIMLPEFSMGAMLDAVVAHQIAELLLVPPLLIKLVRDPIVSRYDLGCVKRFSSGAAPVSEEILQELGRRFPGAGFKQGYGMTESCSCITAHPPDAYDFRWAHTVGKIVPSTEVRIVSPSGADAGAGEPGEILARGPQVVMGYLGNAAATRETFLGGGWLRTGDQGVVDAAGFVTITDRIKEMIKVKGIQVAPAELEDLLLGHAGVEDCAVLGVPDDRAGERPKAYVVAKNKQLGDNGLEGLGRDIIQYVERHKVRHKWVKEVEFAAEIPKSASGKILRRVLRDQARRGTNGVVVRAAGVERAKL
ncbi:Exoglucanase 1 [Pestalotiopsis sp. IQ-011]